MSTVCFNRAINHILSLFKVSLLLLIPPFFFPIVPSPQNICTNGLSKKKKDLNEKNISDISGKKFRKTPMIFGSRHEEGQTSTQTEVLAFQQARLWRLVRLRIHPRCPTYLQHDRIFASELEEPCTLRAWTSSPVFVVQRSLEKFRPVFPQNVGMTASVGVIFC